MKIVDNISYRKEVKRITGGLQTPWHETCLELHWSVLIFNSTSVVFNPESTLSVQDADKLDAMGAFGVMRCSAYSVVINRPLYAAKDDGEMDSWCSIEHYHTKLLKLQGMLRTEEGRRLGEERHKFMLAFLEQVKSEVE